VKLMLRVTVILIFLAWLVPLKAQDAERQLKQIAYDVDFAVLSVWYNQPGDQVNMQVAGTGFLVTPEGYFVTAAHVLQEYKPKSGQMTVGLRQRSGDIGGAWFDLIEKDEAHDLALCKIIGPLGEFAENKNNPGTEKPVASLRVSTAEPITGEFIAIAGFPLGSWSPAIQFGTVAATRTVNPNAGRVPAGQRDLLQISASGNKGNSGSPVIQLDTGEVIGVIVQAEPAPLFTAVQGVPLAQSSGIMLAVPGSWVRDLLKRNNVESVAQPPPKGHTSYYPLPSK
jgi:serine protease Do